MKMTMLYEDQIKSQFEKLIQMARIGGYDETTWRNELETYKSLIFTAAVRTSQQWSFDLEEIAKDIRKHTKEN